MKIEFSGSHFLFDVEGTTSSIQFVTDVMFPYARRELKSFLERSISESTVRDACEQIAVDAGFSSLKDAVSSTDSPRSEAWIIDEVNRLMDSDIKATGLKELQGLIWESGFKTQEMRAHVYPDVVPCLRDWKAKSADLRIYSSGSVAAQRLFFGHTEEGDLLDLLTAHYDTRIGSKKLASSYVEISKDIECEPSDVLFFSDSLDELDAARESAMKTVWVKRPGNPPCDDDRSHPSIESFEDVTWVR